MKGGASLVSLAGTGEAPLGRANGYEALMAVWPSCGSGTRLQSAPPRFDSGFRLDGPVAQRIELLPPKEMAGGSIPSRAAIVPAAELYP